MPVGSLTQYMTKVYVGARCETLNGLTYGHYDMHNRLYISCRQAISATSFVVSPVSNQKSSVPRYPIQMHIGRKLIELRWLIFQCVNRCAVGPIFNSRRLVEPTRPD